MMIGGTLKLTQIIQFFLVQVYANWCQFSVDHIPVDFLHQLSYASYD